MDPTTIIGVDCATDDARVGLALGVAETGRCEVQFAGVCSSERQVADEITDWLAPSARVLIAFDAPLGWPLAMGRALAAHRAGDPLPVPANDLFRRATDRFIKTELGKQSLDVGADRIARTAHAALRLLDDLRRRTGLPIPLAWSADFGERAAAIEVYPAATLLAHGIPARGYKRTEHLAGRAAIMARLKPLFGFPADTAAMQRHADALDAAVCVLAGFDFLRGLAYEPADPDLARHEGWMWVRRFPHKKDAAQIARRA